MGRFVIKPREGPSPESPEALFRQLRPADPNVRDLWLRQGDLLRAYASAADDSDVAVELTTGSGKTLVGLLIGEYRRRSHGERVAYLCPTVQLANQAAEKAARYGIEVELLTGSSRDWDNTAFNHYLRANRVAVSTYAAIFNSKPRLDSPQTVVLDDAHAGEEPVASMWTVQADRLKGQLYGALLDAVIEGLSPAFAERMRDLSPDPRDWGIVELVPPSVVLHHAQELTEALGAHATVEADTSNYFNAGVIGPALKNCMVYVSWREIAIRPLVCPTSTHPPFATAKHRVYMSATFGNDGDLERSFGVRKITRLKSPSPAEEQGFGRRFFLFPGASLPERSADAFVKAAIDTCGRAVVLAPSTAQLERCKTECLPTDVPPISAKEFEANPASFTAPPRAALTLANRYDGIDLPDDVCRLVVLSGLPAQSHLQERFMLERLGARRLMSARIRTRLVQGAGRCTRNNRDYAAVIIRGDGLTSFCSREEELSALPSELQAEIRFGLDNAERSEADLRGLLQDFLAQGTGWREAEGHLRTAAIETEQVEPSEDSTLRAAAPLEVECWEAVWRGDLKHAVTLGQRIADLLGAHPALRGYRALWLYLVSAWARELAEALPGTSYAALSNSLLAESVAASRTTGWMPTSVQTDLPFQSEHGLERRAHRAAALLLRWGVRGRRFEEEMGDLLSRLDQTDAVQFEVGLLRLGEVLGFEAERPRRDASPDCAWRDGTQGWLLFEAKTDAKASSPVDAECVRQTESHFDWVSSQLGWEEPERWVVTVVASLTTVHPSAKTVVRHATLTHPDAVREVARSAVDILREVRLQARVASEEELAEGLAQKWSAAGLGTGDLLKTFGRQPIAGAPLVGAADN